MLAVLRTYVGLGSLPDDRQYPHINSDIQVGGKRKPRGANSALITLVSVRELLARVAKCYPTVAAN
jgi:hypothetical protein